MCEDQTGNRKTFVCPHHGWMYHTEGSLRATRDMILPEGFDAADFLLPLENIWATSPASSTHREVCMTSSYRLECPYTVQGEGYTVRINARLDEDTSKKMEYLREQSGESQTDIIKSAIDLYYESRRSKARAKITILLESDFIGCAQGSADLSEEYKDDLSRSLEEKHDLG